MATRRLTNWLTAYLHYSGYSEAPDSFHFWTGISVLAGALRRQVLIDMGYFQWTPNFYIVFVAPPGIVSKSTTANIGMRLLRQIPGIQFGPDAVTWQSLVQSLAQSTESILMPDGAYHSMSAITIVSSEFGTFLNPNDREMVDVLVSLWDGQVGVFQKATKTMGNDSIENPWINILACTTPAWIAGNFPQYMIGGGFTSRCMFVYGETKRQLIPYPKAHMPEDLQTLEVDLVHDLEIISQLKGNYELSPEAQAWGETWYKEHYENRPKHLDNERFGGYIARKQTHIHKLAMIIAAAQRSELVILPEDLMTSNTLVTSLEADMPKVFANIGRTDATQAAVTIVSAVRTMGKVEVQKLFQTLFNNMTWSDYEDAVKGALRAGFIKETSSGGTNYLIAGDIPTEESTVEAVNYEAMKGAIQEDLQKEPKGTRKIPGH
jgi:hypothetical protein